VYYFREDYDTNLADVGSSFVTGAATLAQQVPRPYITRVSADRLIENSTQSWAVYLQTDVNFTEQFTGTVGLRYTDEKKTVGVTDLRDIRAVPVVGGVPRPDLRLETANLQRLGIPTETSTSLVSPRFALNYKPTDDALLLASATKGFRSGGWNVRGGTAQLFTPFEPEKVWTYELGGQTEWFDRRLRANLTLFELKDEKFQAPSAFVDAVGLVQFITRNDADFENHGAELELEALPLTGLQLYLTVGYQDAKYENVADNTQAQLAECRALRAANQVFGTRCAAGIVTAQGEIAEPVRVPEWTVATGGSYDISITENLVLTAAVNLIYQDETETAAANLTFYIDSAGVYNVDGVGSYVAGSLQESFTLLNASLSLSGPDSKWQVIVDCSNCTDETYTQSAISGYSFINPPRTYSARIKVSF
jgi:iron complex outermembrane receptor protein